MRKSTLAPLQPVKKLNLAEFGDALEWGRHTKVGITQEALSARTGINQLTISEIEAGLKVPTSEMAEILARGLYLSADSLWMGYQHSRTTA